MTWDLLVFGFKTLCLFTILFCAVFLLGVLIINRKNRNGPELRRIVKLPNARKGKGTTNDPITHQD